MQKRFLKSVMTAVLLMFMLSQVPLSEALVGPITKIPGALSDEMIDWFYKLYKIKKINPLKKMLNELPLSNELLEDAYLRIAIQQGKIVRKEAEELHAVLKGVPGFRTTLRKIIGDSPSVTKGHLNELRIAKSASKKGFKIAGIGEKFHDGLTKSPTDIDVLLRKGDRTFAIEAKDVKNLDTITYRADLDTLVQYKARHPNATPVFTIADKSSMSSKKVELFEKEAERRGVQLLFGSADELAIQLEILEGII